MLPEAAVAAPGSSPEGSEMRRNHFPYLALIFLLLFAVSTELAYAQRGGRGGRGGGGRGDGRAPAAVDEATILEEFGKMVEMIWTDEEEDAWKDIDDDPTEEKQAYITVFWERRDPTPGTEDNEYRDLWMDRIAYSQRSFGGEGSPGWETDRGKFYLIYGPEPLLAQERKQVTGSSTAGFGAESRGTRQSTNIIWTIDTTQNPFLEGKEEITFAQYQRSYSRTTGGIELSEEAFLAAVAVSNYFEARRANSFSAGPVGAGGALAPGGAATAAAAPPPPDLLAMQQLMQTGVTRQDLALRQGMQFIPAQQGNTFAIFNFDVGKSGLTFESGGTAGPASMLAFGVLLKKDPAAANGEQFLHEVKIPFSVDPNNGNAEVTSTHSFGMTVEPGDYRLAWGVMDTASERIATVSFEFTVPDFASTELAVPGVIIATGLEQMTDAIEINTVYPRTRVGQLELETNMDNEFGRNDSLLLLYFIQGLGVDTATQQNLFEITHRILLAGTEDSIARLPAQEMKFNAIQQEIPLGQVSQIEPGTAYEIEIQINDQITGNQLTYKVPFSVRGG